MEIQLLSKGVINTESNKETQNARFIRSRTKDIART